MTKRNPRVLGVVAQKGACEFYRIGMPYAELIRRGLTVGWTNVEQVARLDLSRLDVLVLARILFADLKHAERMYRNAHEDGKAIVYETDDDLATIPEWNPGKLPDHVIEVYRWMVANADLVTCSTEHLAAQLRALNPNVVVLPNCIEPDLWKVKKRVLRVVKGLTVGVHGGHSHFRDWEVLAEVFPILAKRYPDLQFVVAGYHPSYLDDLGLGERLIKIGWVPLEYHPSTVAQIDIGLCPLHDDLFSRSKSPIKFFEFAMHEVPVVASPTVYQEEISHGRTGFLARTTDEWVTWVSKLVEDPALRREIGASARGDVLRKHHIRELATHWMDAYRRAWAARA